MPSTVPTAQGDGPVAGTLCKQCNKKESNAIIQEEDTTWMVCNYMAMTGISHVEMLEEAGSLGFVPRSVHASDEDPIYSPGLDDLLQSMGCISRNEFSGDESSEIGETAQAFEDFSEIEELEDFSEIEEVETNEVSEIGKGEWKRRGKRSTSGSAGRRLDTSTVSILLPRTRCGKGIDEGSLRSWSGLFLSTG